jgi:hypothetical protein
MRPTAILLLSITITLTTILALGQPDKALGAGSFLETFTGAPSSPTPWHPSNWDVTVESRELNTMTVLSTMHAGHGTDCSAPPAAHDFSAYEDSVFQCKDHVMTAIKGEGYALIYLSPNQMADFSAGEAVVRFDVSTMRTSLRDFLDIWITPFNDNVQLVGDIGVVDLNGQPRNAVHVRQDQFNGNTIYRGNVVRNFNEQTVGSNDGLGVEQILTASATVRTTFELRLSRTHMKFGIPALNAWWVDNNFADLGWTSGIVQLGHHSYNPEKDCSGCTANTWHWDNVSISPAIPFTILNGSRRAVSAASPGAMTFPAPAPAGSRLRFTGIGRNLAVSVDGGSTWIPAQRQAYAQQLGEEHFDSYWTPVPAGTQSVLIRGSNWFAGAWIASNVAIWANTAPSGVVTTPAPTVAPTPAPTVAPTARPTVAPTLPPTVAPTIVPPTPFPTVGPPGAGLSASSSVMWQGNNYYLHGANVPWLNWACDFGCGTGSGVSSAASYAALDARFAQAKAAGLRTIRWWTFEGNAWQIRSDSSGTPTSVDPAVYADFDKALALAAKHDLYIDFVLFSSPTSINTAWETDPAKRAALASALTPLFARYNGNSHLLSWEVFNEPEFDIWANKIDQGSVQQTVRAIANAVHGNSTAYVTVGSAMLDGLPMWKGQGLDYYQAHWYDYMSPGEWCALCTDYASVRALYDLDHPLVIGELYIGTDTPGRFTSFFDKGYAGAWAWSLFPAKTSDGLAVDMTQATNFAAAHANTGPRAGGAATTPAPTVAPTAVPTTAPTAVPTSPATTAPTMGPTLPPTIAPTSAPTVGPTLPPTTAPTIGPTLPPTTAPQPVPSPTSSTDPTVPNVPAPSGAIGPGNGNGGNGNGGNGNGNGGSRGSTGVGHAPAPATVAPNNNPLAGLFGPAAKDSYHARWFDQTAYVAMQPGEIGRVTLRYRNTGTVPWVKGVEGQQANLGVWGESPTYAYATADDFYRAMATEKASGMSFDSTALGRAVATLQRVSQMVASVWPTADRAAIQLEDIVAPGELGTFTFTVRAPLTPGVYKLPLRPVIDGTVWMEDDGAFILITTLADYHSAWVGQSTYPTVRAGAMSAPITVTFKNTGHQSWVRGILGQQVNLGIDDAPNAWQSFSAGWPTGDRVAVQSESKVAPGENVTFTFQVRAPSAPGTYRLRVRPVIDGTMWLEDQGVYVLITIVP